MKTSVSSISKGAAQILQIGTVTTEHTGALIPCDMLEQTAQPEAPPKPADNRFDALTGLELAHGKASNDQSAALEATSRTTPANPSHPHKGSEHEGNETQPTPEALVFPAAAAGKAKQAVVKKDKSEGLVSATMASVVKSTVPSPPENWELILGSWQQLLQEWSRHGLLEQAAKKVLALDGPNAKPQRGGFLQSHLSAWKAGNFQHLPTIIFLSGEAMHGAMGAYSIKTGEIYLNADWLRSANEIQIHLLLTEELTHSLDALLNWADTPGDEGEQLAALLFSKPRSQEQKAAISEEDDTGLITVNGESLAVEFAASGITGTAGTYNLSAGSMAYTVSINSTANNGADLLIAAYSASTGALIGWQIVNRGTSRNLQNTSYSGSFNFAATALNKVDSTAVVLRVWQGTAGSSYGAPSSSNTTGIVTYGTSNLVAGVTTGFSINTTTSPATGSGAVEFATATSMTVTGGSFSLTLNAVTVDTVGPLATAAIDSAADDVGILQGTVASGARSDDNALTLAGSLNGTWANGNSVRVFDGSTYVGEAIVTSNTSWNFTTSALAAGSHSFSARVRDSGGNFSAASSAYVVTIDTTAPTITASITSATVNEGTQQRAIANGGSTDDTTPTLSGTLSALPASGDQVRIYDGTLFLGSATVSISSNSATWSFTTPTINSGSHSFTARVADAAGNQGKASVAFALMVRSSDTTPPTVAISSNITALKAAETASITFTLSEASTDFTTTDVTATGGTLSNFSGSGSSYTATFTPAANSTSNGVVSIASSTFSDAAGNTNQDGADTNNTVTLTVDTIRPTIAISSNVTALKAGETTSISFTLSEASTNFTATDITATGGSLSNFSGSGGSYTSTFTAATNTTSNGVISVASNSFSDAAGNTNQDGADPNNTLTLSTGVTTVTSVAELQAAINAASAGDVIQLANGTYRDSTLLVGRSGITIRAQTPGGVRFTGSHSITISGNDNVLRGFRFEDGSISGVVVQVSGSRNLLTELSFDGYAAAKYIVLKAGSQHNAVTWSHFARKPTSAPPGNLIHVDPDPTVPGYHTIGHNSFLNMPGAGGDSGNECIRIGNGAQSTYSSRTVVEYNYFEDTGAGDSEAISVKSRDNVLRWNTMRNNPNAMFVFRNGNDNVAYGNFFIHSGGIRVKEANNIWVYNNHFEYAGVGGTMNAVTYDYVSPNLNNVNFIHNTFVEPNVISLGSGAIDNTWANNLLTKTSGSLFSGSASGISWDGNLYNGNLGITIPAGGATDNGAVGLEPNTLGVHALVLGSSAINHASTHYPTIYDVPGIDDDPSLALDVEGQPRPMDRTLKDVGSDEWTEEPSRNRPLTLTDAGPSYLHPSGIGGNLLSDAALTLAADPITGAAMLTQAELAPIAAAAISYWATQGIDSQSLLTLHTTDVSIINLGGSMLGWADGNYIAIDDDAAGHGWATSLDVATPGKVDLYSTLIHEYGHILGCSHDRLGDQLAVGERLLPLQTTSNPLLI